MKSLLICCLVFTVAVFAANKPYFEEDIFLKGEYESKYYGVYTILIRLRMPFPDEIRGKDGYKIRSEDRGVADWYSYSHDTATISSEIASKVSFGYRSRYANYYQEDRDGSKGTSYLISNKVINRANFEFGNNSSSTGYKKLGIMIRLSQEQFQQELTAIQNKSS